MGQRALASQLPARSKELATSMSRVAAPFSEPVHKIEAIRHKAPDFKDAKDLRDAFDEAHKSARRNALEANEKNAEVVIALAKVQAILSERGEKYETMRRDAGIGHWTWTSYFLWFKKKFNYNRTLRTVQRKIAELEGKRVCIECRKANGHMPSCPKHKSPTKPTISEPPSANLKPSEIEELAIELAEHVVNKRLESALKIAMDILQKTGSKISTTEPNPKSRVA